MLAGIVLLAVGWAQSSSLVGPANRFLSAAPGETLQYSTGDDVHVARVTREGMTSGDVVLRRSGDGLRGVVGAEPVALSVDPRRLAGTIGDARIALDVVRSPGRMEVVGHFGTRSVALDLRPDLIEGQVGPCWYRMPLERGAYSGRVACGGAAEPVRLTVPVSLLARPDGEIAAMVTALLAR
jgi:hypothetical protein